jgi:hypothetical protein
LNGDGQPDLVVGDFNGWDVSIFENKSWPGTLSFGTTGGISTGSGTPANSSKSVSLGDIDGDESTTSCIVGLSSCSTENPCHLHNKYVTIRNNLATMLEETTFIQLIEMEHFTISNLQI